MMITEDTGEAGGTGFGTELSASATANGGKDTAITHMDYATREVEYLK